ncbi:MAG: M61 family metallopeptidase [Rhodothermales bacterium]|nr:M61 family metallopeptidase [Rhodothermales bacterium]
MKPVLGIVLALSILVIPASAQREVTYDVSFPRPEHHEAEISMTVDGTRSGELVEFRMSRTSPGRYALHEFAKNVYSVEAHDGSGAILDIERPNPHQWNVVATGNKVVLRYTLFADRAGGTYSGIDRTHAHLNIPATFMFARQFSDVPIRVSFSLPNESWKVATQLVPTANETVFTAPDLYYFLDSPIEISDHDVRSWNVEMGDRSTTVNLVVHHAESEVEVDTYYDMARKVVDEEVAVFEALPENDYGTYTFLADYLPHVAGDGMEHRNSTYIVSTRPLSTGARRNLGTLAHEYFHQWNVERLRPSDLEPFDFEEANMTGELWFSEGFTSYYTALVMRRTGINSDSEFASSIGGAVNAVVNLPGRKYFSAREMSMQAPFVDAARSVDPTNRDNTFISYYTFGNAIGLGLDLTLRSAFPGTTLDHYMQLLWRKYGETEIPFTSSDLRNALYELVNDRAFADGIFDNYIEGHEAFDYSTLLARAGFHVRQRYDNRPFLGAQLEEEDGGVIVAGPTLETGTLYAAGVGQGDTIVQLNQTLVTDLEQLGALLDDIAPGDTVSITYTQRGDTYTSSVPVAENMTLEVVTFEDAGMELSETQIAFRNEWLRSRVK